MSSADLPEINAEYQKEAEVCCNPKEEEEDGASSPGEYIDSPEPIAACDVENVEQVGENAEISSQTSQEGKPFAAMEGELDFEDEVGEEKAEIKTKFENESEKQEGGFPKSQDQQSGDEDGQCTPEKKSKGLDGKKEGSIEEGEDDGEISDEDDLEEGEVKDNTPVPKQPARQVCRFFNRGQCTWGNVCRFLHLSVNEKGHYNMFAPNPRYSPCYGLPSNTAGNGMGPSNAGPAVMSQRSGHHGGPDFMPVPPTLPPLPPVEPTPVETAWERGLRQAKELVKKANKRKEEEPDFEEKRLNLSIDVNERNVPDYDKENEFLDKSYKRQNEVHPYKYDEPNDGFDNGEREAREYWRGGRYENFEIRWTRQGDMHKERRDRERSRGRRMSGEREKHSKHGRSKDRWRDDRLFEIQMRTRADEWIDPWRRSKTPKGGRHTRSRSGSYSSVSSYSYSDRSSRSSCSYSRSSSRSSCGSSRRKPSPTTEVAASPKGPSRFLPAKKKLGTRSSSSRSRSISRTPSISRSRSRSYSRSLSMDSVSSASSSVSHSSSASGSLGDRNPHVSVLRKQEDSVLIPKLDSKGLPSRIYQESERLKQYDRLRDPGSIKQTQNDPNATGRQRPNEIPPFPSFQHLLPVVEKKRKDRAKEPFQEEDSVLIPKVDSKGAPSSLYQEMQRLKQYEKLRDIGTLKQPQNDPGPRRPFETTPFPSLQHLLPSTDKPPKEPVKGLHKQQIKLTLLNKPTPSKLASLPKKELDVTKLKTLDKDDSAKTGVGVKRPSTPPLSTTVTKPATPVVPKKSASSRRDELLKQLKAVEDAIARKRAKFC